MKKLTLSITLLILSALLLTTTSYAWATTLNRGTYNAPRFRAALPEETNYIYISNDQSTKGAEVYTSQIAQASLLPVTTANCDYFYWENNDRLSSTEKERNVISETVYLTSDAQYTRVQVQEVNVQGAGLLADAIRVGIVSNTGDIVIASRSGSDGFLRIITRNGHVPVTVYVWIEGTDPACTYEAIASAGNIQVSVTLEGINA